ncbi:hypothetical protein [Gramella sp. KN1008]|uniref:hypothetical protein n=1 Tax=Gramella sp. KN1008 TaxID=2529298 RepID=UPI0026BCC14E
MGFILLIITTFILVLLTILASLQFPFPILYFLMVTGQILLLFTVYKVLTDKYVTKKTFEDYYEDHPVNRD